MKKILFLALSIVILSLGELQAQQWGVGARVGYWDDVAFSLDLKKYDASTAMEFVGSYYDNNNFEFTFLYEWHNRFAEYFDVYYGYGATVADYDNSFGLGFTGVLGIEYFIPWTKFSIAADWMPQLRLVPETEFNGNFSVVLRYSF